MSSHSPKATTDPAHYEDRLGEETTNTRGKPLSIRTTRKQLETDGRYCSCPTLQPRASLSAQSRRSTDPSWWRSF
jgi:hypothetical protein